MKKTLPKILGMAMAFLLSITMCRAQVNLAATDSSYLQNFNTLSATGTTNDSSSLPLGWMFIETGTNANATYAASTGSSNAGNTYSLGLDSDRAFGGLQSGSVIPTIGASFRNNTGDTITSLQINYTGEQWRLGATPRAQADRLDFQYSVNTSSLSSGTWINYDSLDFSAPVLSGTVGALDGNALANSRNVQGVISGLSIAPGATFWLRWTDFNVASSDDALGIDNFWITPISEVTPPFNQHVIAVSPPILNFGQVNVNTSKVITYAVSSYNLIDSLIHVTSLSSFYTLSLDGINYNDTLVIKGADSVYVKFTPTHNGVESDTIRHYGDGLTADLFVTGSGFDQQSSIISIAEARTKTNGTNVTITGRITVANQQGSPSFIQDATGGIPVFDYNFSNAIAIGDSVTVTGDIGFFNNQIQIGSNVFFQIADSVKRFITPKAIQLSELAANEGLLVTVQNVQLANKAFVFYPQSTEQMTDSTLMADLRIDGDTDIPGLTKPQGTVNITGVVGRFKTNAQLLPRFRGDIPGTTAPQTPYDSVPKSATFDLMNWNLEFFGAKREDYPEEYGPADEALQLSNVQHVINSVHADVIAVQEVSNDSLFNELIHELPGYNAICSDRYSYSFQGPDSTFPPQKVCFIYDSATVQIESARAMFENMYDSARINGTILPGYPTGDASSFWSSGRLPFMITANVTSNGTTEKIRFINIHAKSGATVADYNRRVYDAQVLKDSLDAYYGGDKIVILGDYNDDLNQSIVTGKPTSYTTFVQDSSYLPVTRALSVAGAKSTISFNGVIDNQIITTELQSEYLGGSEHIITPFLDVPNYATTTSDHLPVVSRFAFNTISSNVMAYFTTTSASVIEGSDSIQVHIQLSSPAVADLLLTLSVQDSAGATYGSDYTSAPPVVNHVMQVTIPAGSDNATIFLLNLDDIIDEPNESVTLTILPSAGILISDSSNTFTFTIIDNDSATISFEEAEVSREEGSDPYDVKLKLSSAQSSQQSVTIHVANSTSTFYGRNLDYTTSPSVGQNKITLTIPAGVDEVHFTVTPNTDIFRENNETITFSIANVSSGLTKGTQSKSIFTIVDVAVCLPVFAVFPNPTFGKVNIYTLPANENNIVSGTLIDPQGTILLVAQGTVAQLSDQFTEVIQHKKRGVYILILKECDTVITIRLVKL